MIPLETLSSPLWTDVVQAIGVGLGLPLTIWGIFKLFKTDKEKERKIAALESLATSQNAVVTKLQDQVDQLSLQTAQFQYQSSLMQEQNKLFEKQIELQTNIFMHDKGVEEQKLMFEKQKRISEIRPYFVNVGSGTGPHGFHLELLNKGGEARDIRIVSINTDFVTLQPIASRSSRDRGSMLKIAGHARPDKTYFNSYNVTMEANLEYLDIDNNLYQQNIQRLGNSRYIISDPVLVENPTEV